MSLSNSYVLVNTTRDEGYDIQFRFKTTLPNGLLAIGKGLTLYFLVLVNGRLNLGSSLLNKWEGVFVGSGLNDSKWQKVMFFICLNFFLAISLINRKNAIIYNGSKKKLDPLYARMMPNYLDLNIIPNWRTLRVKT